MGDLLSVKDVTVEFSGFKALQGVDFKVNKNELKFLIGPNGAGKTTVLDIICGKTKPSNGNVLFKKKINLLQMKEHDIVKTGIGRKFQTPSIFDSLTVEDNIELAAIYNNGGIISKLMMKTNSEYRNKIEEILEMVELIEYKNVLAGNLSHGQKQWLEIGMLLVQEPELLLLDEPVAGIGKAETEQTGRILKEIVKKCSAVIVEDDIEFVTN